MTNVEIAEILTTFEFEYELPVVLSIALTEAVKAIYDRERIKNVLLEYDARIPEVTVENIYNIIAENY